MGQQSACITRLIYSTNPKYLCRALSYLPSSPRVPCVAFVTEVTGELLGHLGVAGDARLLLRYDPLKATVGMARRALNL